MNMKKVICDHCKSREGRTISFETGRSFSPIGDHQWHFEYVDLCMECLVERIGIFLRAEQDEVKNRLINTVTKGKSEAA